MRRFGFRADGYARAVTIPDLGHCVGSGTAPAEGTVELQDDGSKSGICPACSGRFPLHHTGAVALHGAAEADEREPWSEPAV